MRDESQIEGLNRSQIYRPIKRQRILEQLTAEAKNIDADSAYCTRFTRGLC